MLRLDVLLGGVRGVVRLAMTVADALALLRRDAVLDEICAEGLREFTRRMTAAVRTAFPDYRIAIKAQLRAYDLDSVDGRVEADEGSQAFFRNNQFAISQAQVEFRDRYGMDLVFDVRFLTNPYWEPDLKPLSGLEPPVREYVLRQPAAERFLEIGAQIASTSAPTRDVGGVSDQQVVAGQVGELGARMGRESLDRVRDQLGALLGQHVPGPLDLVQRRADSRVELAEPEHRICRIGRISGVLGDEVAELLLGGAVRRRVDARVEVEAHAALRAGGQRVVVEGDDPHPAAVEDVVHRALGPGRGAHRALCRRE